MARFFITDHAAKRFRQRFMSELTIVDAHARLVELAPTSVLIREIHHGKQQLRAVASPDCRLVCAKAEQWLVVTTVLFADEAPSADELDAILRQFTKKTGAKIANAMEHSPNVVARVTKRQRDERIAELIAIELGKRIPDFLDELAQQRKVTMEQAELRVATAKEKARAAEAAVLAKREEQLTAVFAAENAAYQRMVRDVVPMLARMATTDDSAAMVLAKMVEHVPSVAQLGVQLGDNER